MGNDANKPSSPLKLAIPIVVLLAVVFGVTMLSQYSPKSDPDDTSGGKAGPQKASSVDLRFGVASKYAGFFEPGPEVYRETFWFENRSQAPLTVQLSSQRTILGGSQAEPLQSSNGVRVTAIPPELADQLAMSAIISCFPQGLVTTLPLGMAGSAAEIPRLPWQELNLRASQRPECKIPGTTTEKHLVPNQWGIVELQFQVVGIGQATQIESNFTIQNEGSQPGTAKLAVTYLGVEPFDVYPRFINLGEWKESSDPRQFEFHVFSSARGSRPLGVSRFTFPLMNLVGDFAPPAAKVQLPKAGGDPGPFVTVSGPERAAEPEMGKLFDTIQKAQKGPIWVESAYRYTVTVTPRAGEARVDLGPLEREIELTIPNMEQSKKVFLRGMVHGSIWLDNNRNDIDLLSYRANDGIVQTLRLITEQRDAELNLLQNECEPKSLQLKLTKLPPVSDRGFYELLVSVPKNSQAGNWSGVIVLEQKGSRPQRMRIPIRGQALAAR